MSDRGGKVVLNVQLLSLIEQLKGTFNEDFNEDYVRKRNLETQ